MWHKDNTGMKKRIKGIAKAVLALSMCLVMPMASIPAAAADRTGSISITYKYYNESTGKTEPVSGGNSVGLYKVADVIVDNGFKFKVDERFSSVGTIPDTSKELDAENVDLAEAMSKIAEDYDFDIAPVEMDEDGKVSFEGLEVGMYLVMQAARGKSNDAFYLSSFLVTIPYRNADGSLTYDINCDAKPIGVYKEKVPPSPPPKRIPQTGQLWWPAGILAASGILLLVVGLIRKKRT